MNAFLLLQALRDALAENVGALKLPSRKRGKTEHVWREPGIYIGSMPPGVNAAVEAVPFVCIQTMQGSQGDDGLHVVTVAFRVAVQDPDPEAAESHLHNLLSLIRRSVMGKAGGDLPRERFRMQPDERGRLWLWQRPDEQLPPYAEAYALTTWAMKGIE